MSLTKRFIDNIKKQHYWTAGEPVVLALSGGVDSVVLLDLLNNLPDELKPTIITAHVNHHLREAADDDEKLVQELANQNGLRLHVHHWEKDDQPEKGIEAAGRTVRYTFFKEVAKKEGAQLILTAHHLNDQAETIMMRFIRGSSLEELSGIPSIRNEEGYQLFRPLLPFSKEELYRYAKEANLHWREDESNYSVNYTRNRYRQRILPMLKEENPKLEKQLAHYADEINQLLELASPIVEEALSETITIDKKKVTINRFKFLTLGKPLGTRVLTEALKRYNADEEFLVKQIHLPILYEWMIDSPPNSTLNLPNHLIAQREYDVCYIQRDKQFSVNKRLSGSEQASYTLTLNKWVQLNESEKIGLFPIGVKVNKEKPNTQVIYLNKQDITLPLLIRHRKKGDKIRVKGLNGTKKVKDVFIDQKVPAEKRDKAWLVEDQKGQTVWLVNYKQSTLSRDQETDTISYVLVYHKNTH